MPRVVSFDRAKATTLIRRGLDDVEVAGEVDIHAKAITRLRNQLGVSGYNPERNRRRREKGIRAMRTNRQMLLMSLNLPSWLQPPHVRAIVLLLDGPQTLAQLRSRCGLPPALSASVLTQTFSVPDGPTKKRYCLPELVEAGLVTRVTRGIKGHYRTQGTRQPSLYMLTRKTLSLMADANKEK